MSPVTACKPDIITIFNLNVSEFSNNKFKQRDNLRRGRKIKMSHKNCKNKANSNLIIVLHHSLLLKYMVPLYKL